MTMLSEPAVYASIRRMRRRRHRFQRRLISMVVFALLGGGLGFGSGLLPGTATTGLDPTPSVAGRAQPLAATGGSVDQQVQQLHQIADQLANNGG
jgi:hypothetical protein